MTYSGHYQYIVYYSRKTDRIVLVHNRLDRSDTWILQEFYDEVSKSDEYATRNSDVFYRVTDTGTIRRYLTKFHHTYEHLVDFRSVDVFPLRPIESITDLVNLTL